MSILILSDNLIVAKHIELQLQDLDAGYETVRVVEDLRSALQKRDYDLVVISRATKERFGDGCELVSIIQEAAPQAKIVVTFGVRGQMADYLNAGVRFFYLGQPLEHFAEYVRAVRSGQPVPLFARHDDGHWVAVDH
jgi:DNA-binding NarL/FixJ family response regulator